MTTVWTLIQLAALAGSSGQLGAAESAVPPAPTVAIEQPPGSIGTVVSGYLESSGCFGEDHATWYAFQRQGSQVVLVGMPVAGGGTPHAYPLPAVLTTDISTWVPLAVAADAAWVVLVAKDRVVRWAPRSGAVEAMLDPALGPWGCQRIPGASTQGTLALRCDRRSLLLVDGAASPHQTATPVVGARGFLDAACWCGSDLWSPVVSMDPGMAVQRLFPLAAPMTVTRAEPIAVRAASDPRLQLLGADGGLHCLWGTTGGQLVRIAVESGVMTAVADAADPGLLQAPFTTTIWALDGQRQLLVGATLSSHPPMLGEAPLAEMPDPHLHPGPVPQLSLCQRSILSGDPDGQAAVSYDLTAVWQLLLARSSAERLHPTQDHHQWLVAPRILGISGGEVAMALDVQIRYGAFGSVYEAILILPHGVGGTTVVPRVAGILRHTSSGIANPIHDYPLVSADPGHALAVQYRDGVLVVDLGAGPPPKASRDPVPR